MRRVIFIISEISSFALLIGRTTVFPVVEFSLGKISQIDLSTNEIISWKVNIFIMMCSLKRLKLAHA